ncbi:HEAT repeat domain-containing protein [candidate division KSB1 bacterium]
MESPEVIYRKLTGVDESQKAETGKSVSKEYISNLLSSPDWKVRNLGIKIIGELRSKEFIDDIIRFLTDRTPASFIDRILGGDFFQVGFIRRNSAETLSKINDNSEKVLDALVMATEDPYWEVRVAAVRAISTIFPESGSERAVGSIGKLFSDKKFEVVSEAVLAIGEISTDPGIMTSFKKLYDHPNSRVKKSIVSAVNRLHRRDIIKDDKVIISELSNIFIPGMYKPEE